MKPAFALSLSLEGISLLHRALDGWRTVGDVPLDEDGLPGALADLRARANLLERSPWHSKVIIPNDQIRYLSVETGPLQGDARKGRVEAELENATPYALNDLVYDLSVEGNLTHVAAVARETLDEAEAFAVEHKFNPVSFAARPEGPEFVGEPHFGQSAHATALAEVDRVTPDGDPVYVIGPAKIPEVPPPAAAAPVVPAPKASVIADPVKPVEPPEAIKDTAPAPAPTPSFSSRRGKSGSGAPHLTGASRDVPPSVTPAQQPIIEPVAAPAEVSVAAPVLDIPPDPEDPPVPVQEAKTGFLSRRRATKQSAPPEGQNGPEPLPFKGTTKDAAAPETEADRMTVFGARDTQKIGGKPRFLGVMLTAALLFFLAAVAAWAAIFLEDGVNGLFRGQSKPTELVARPPIVSPPSGEEDAVQVSLPPAKSVAPVPTTPPLSNTPAPDVPVADLPTSPEVEPVLGDRPPAQANAPALPLLSDTDTAVLDALRRDPQAGEPDTQPPVANTETTTTAETRYAATGIWPNAPDVPVAPFIIDLKDLYLASIDRTDMSQDAVALPPRSFLDTDAPLDSVTSPAAAGTAAAVNQHGLVDPTPGGAITPDGVMVYLGRPDIVPPTTPTRFETTPDTSVLRDEYLAALQPRLRPDALVELNQRANLGGKSLDELAGLRPKLRPKTSKQIAEEDETPTAQAVVVSKVPQSRPRNFATLVKRAKPTPKPTTTQTAAAAASAASTASLDSTDGGSSRTGRTGGSNVSGGSVKPIAPSSASVARQATLKNSINLQRLNLIGVYGTPSNRRALIRLPSGRYKKVKVGDLVDGGRVVAIGESELHYEKGSRSTTLTMPSG